MRTTKTAIPTITLLRILSSFTNDVPNYRAIYPYMIRPNFRKA